MPSVLLNDSKPDFILNVLRHDRSHVFDIPIKDKLKVYFRNRRTSNKISTLQYNKAFFCCVSQYAVNAYIYIHYFRSNH
jgi:hypothetical protein